MLRADEHLVFPLRVKRFDFPGSIRIRFEDLPRGITVPEMNLSEGQSEINAMLFTAADAPQGIYEIRIAAASGAVKDASTIRVTVLKPETKIEIKPEKKPVSSAEIKVEHKAEPKPEKTVEPRIEAKPAPKPEDKPSHALLVSSPSHVVLQSGQTQYVEVKAAMMGQESLPAEPTIALAASPQSNLAWAVDRFRF